MSNWLKTISVVFAMLALMAVNAYSATWEMLEKDYYLDVDSITVMQDNIRKYWIKTIPKSDEFKKALKTAGINYRVFSHALYENEVDCNNKEGRITGEYYYSKQKSILYSGIYKQAVFEPVLPGSNGEREYLSICNMPTIQK